VPGQRAAEHRKANSSARAERLSARATGYFFPAGCFARRQPFSSRTIQPRVGSLKCVPMTKASGSAIVDELEARPTRRRLIHVETRGIVRAFELACAARAMTRASGTGATPSSRP
jgi:hypothetical protein